MESRRAIRRRRRTRRVRAVLAAGVVLGVGTMATLAAWTDTENATGSFGASVFGTESQTAASDWASHTSGAEAALTFGATAMSPDNSYYAWLNIRTTEASTVGGTVRLSAVSSSGTVINALDYRAIRMAAPHPTATCSATAFTNGSPTYIAGGASTYLSLSTVPATPVANTIGAAGAQLGFCFEVRMPAGTPGSYQGADGTVTWTFTATSAS